MTWVVKIDREDPSYLHDDYNMNWTPNRRRAIRYASIELARAAMWKARATAKGFKICVARCVPKIKKGTEAEIRRNERQRLADLLAFEEDGVISFAGARDAEAHEKISLKQCTGPLVNAIRRAMTACEWKP